MKSFLNFLEKGKCKNCYVLSQKRNISKDHYFSVQSCTTYLRTMIKLMLLIIWFHKHGTMAKDLPDKRQIFIVSMKV